MRIPNLSPKAVAAVLALSLVLSSCSLFQQINYRPLEVEGTSFRLQELGLREATLAVAADVRNPNPFNLPIGGLDYTLNLGDMNLMDQVRHEGLTIAAGEVETIETPVSVRYGDVADLILSVAEGARTIPYSGEIGLSMERLGLERRFAIPLEGEIPVPEPPNIRIEDFDWQFALTEGLSGTVTLNAEDEVDRLGNLTQVLGNLLLNDEPLVEVTNPEVTDTGRVVVPWSMSSARAVRSVLPALRGGDFNLRYEGEMVFDAPWGPVRVPLNIGGNP
ncbi:LEA type 2 family protein [Candidatus Sumerlaeota bacterium]|nr:LEA type 2 family protein [Candidatus Sumerlaeota bacterium]